MKTARSIVAGAALLLAIGALTPCNAQPAAAPAKHAKNAGGKKAPAKKMVQLTNARLLEKALGKPFTDDQKTAIDTAATVYNDAVAKAAGLTSAEVTSKIDDYKKAAEAAKKAAAPAPKAAAPK